MVGGCKPRRERRGEGKEKHDVGVGKARSLSRDAGRVSSRPRFVLPRCSVNVRTVFWGASATVRGSSPLLRFSYFPVLRPVFGPIIRPVPSVSAHSLAILVEYSRPLVAVKPHLRFPSFTLHTCPFLIFSYI